MAQRELTDAEPRLLALKPQPNPAFGEVISSNFGSIARLCAANVRRRGDYERQSGATSRACAIGANRRSPMSTRGRRGDFGPRSYVDIPRLARGRSEKAAAPGEARR